MRLSVRPLTFTSLSLGLGLLFACGKDPSGEALETSVEAIHTRTQVLGNLRDGQTRRTRYSNPPEYRAYRFTAGLGEQVDVWVRSDNGDAMGWILDASGAVVAQNDDADPSTLDAHLEVTTTGPSQQYLVLFREYHRSSARFSVRLDVAPASCSYGGRVYPTGASFPATDGCNTCTCGESGVACTELGCPSCGPASEPERRYIGHSTEECATILFTCVPDMRPFTSPCGCGCEPSSPAATCDPENEPNRRYVGGSREECMRIRFSCVPGTRSFANDCGCGCENEQ